MSKVPFEKFIIALLFSNKSVPFVAEKLKSFNYYISEPEILEIFDDIRGILPPSITELLNSGNPLTIDDPVHSQWLKQFDIVEIFDFMHKKYDNPPPYFKWIDDIMWAHTYEDVMTLINIFMFNGEPFESISDIISFKYRKKIGIDALQLYEKILWNSGNMTAKEALYHCIPFRTNAVIVQKIRMGNDEPARAGDDTNDGSSLTFLFPDNNYIQSKIGYKDVKIPTAKEFFDSVKKDSYYKYQESMNMAQSAEVFDEEGSNDKIGAYEIHRISRRNVEEQRAKLSKMWLDMYLKANESAPEAGEHDDFFKQLEQVSLDFHDDEKIMDISQVKDILEDIKGDI
jgi:hypothetical protein